MKICVMHGDQTGEELLQESLRVLKATELPVEIKDFDLSLDNRERTRNGVVYDAAEATTQTGFALKAATNTSEEIGGTGSPNRILREEIGGEIILRKGSPLPGINKFAIDHPVSIVRMARGDAYGAEEERQGFPDSPEEKAWRKEVITRDLCYKVAEFAFQKAEQKNARVYGGPKWTVSPVYEGMLKEEMDKAAKRYPQVDYWPQLIDASFAGIVGNMDKELFVPSLNRDGDLLADFVLALFGSLAGSESLILGEKHNKRTVLAEAPHGTAPLLEGKNVANPMAMILALGSLLQEGPYKKEGQKINDAVFQTLLHHQTADLGGQSSTSDFTDQVIEKYKHSTSS